MRVDKPWGWYKDLERTPNLVIKKIHIKPFSKFSLQKHYEREEFWYIVSGYGKLTLDDTLHTVGPGDSYKIKKEQIHRLEAYGQWHNFRGGTKWRMQRKRHLQNRRRLRKRKLLNHQSHN